jgi:hypothetical protein
MAALQTQQDGHSSGAIRLAMDDGRAASQNLYRAMQFKSRWMLRPSAGMRITFKVCKSSPLGGEHKSKSVT